ncbi:hypothetical protein MTR67_024817 [Solanum verrucosum]|uniref:Uncharacterized protein n=1 Tax=Solanum verrucosum TaxID=315347 RepID=A0AAF0TSK7_SOLVR|nr:hypothetical protein MTR67_024817 [Solanum verrucosum]
MLNTASQNIIRAKFTFSFIPIFLVICGTNIVISCPSCQEIVRFDICNCSIIYLEKHKVPFQVLQSASYLGKKGVSLLCTIDAI